jgi:nucleoside-diphosphate-sugar epimerase
VARILLLGGSYFIGRHIAHDLLRRGFEVCALNRGTRENPGVHTLVADRNDPVAMRRRLGGLRFDVVVDTSCYDGTQALIAEAALAGRYGRWIHLSAASVYADTAPRPLVEGVEETGSLAFGAYAQKKLAAERLLTEACGERLVSLRPAYVYGPGNNLAREREVWSRLLNEEPIYLPEQGEAKVSFIHVHDLAEVVAACIQSDTVCGQAYNVAHPEWVTLRQWVDVLAQQAEVSAQIQNVPRALAIDARQYFPFRDLDLTLDVQRIQRDLAVRPRYDVHEGLAHTFRSYERGELAGEQRRSSVEIELSTALARESSGAHEAPSNSRQRS